MNVKKQSKLYIYLLNHTTNYSIYLKERNKVIPNKFGKKNKTKQMKMKKKSKQQGDESIVATITGFML